MLAAFNWAGVDILQRAPLIQASLSPRSMSRYLGLSGNHGRVTSWMKPGMALLARRYCQHCSLPRISLSINTQQHGRCFNETGPFRKVRVCVPESNHLSQHNTEGCENRRWQRDRPSQVLRGTLSEIHGLHVHADPCKTPQTSHSKDNSAIVT